MLYCRAARTAYPPNPTVQITAYPLTPNPDRLTSVTSSRAELNLPVDKTCVRENLSIVDIEGPSEHIDRSSVELNLSMDVQSQSARCVSHEQIDVSSQRAQLNVPDTEPIQPGTFDSPPGSPSNDSRSNSEGFESPQLGTSPTTIKLFDSKPSSPAKRSPTLTAQQKSGIPRTSKTKFDPKSSSTPKCQKTKTADASATTSRQRETKTVKFGELKRDGRLEKSSPSSPKGSRPSTSLPPSPRRQQDMRRQDPKR